MITIGSLLVGSAVLADSGDPRVVKSVDLQKYSGVWYDIARKPSFFQDSCLRSTAEYQVIDDDSISVKNTCYKSDNKISEIKGIAKITNLNEPAKLKVRFNFFAKGDYWISELDENYEWAVVSGPAKKSLFILSRKAPMQKELLDEILVLLKSKGFKTDDLIFDQY